MHANTHKHTQDISTNLVVVIGPAGSGRSELVAALAAELVAAAHWGEAFWVDLAGVASATTAGEVTWLQISPATASLCACVRHPSPSFTRS